MEPSVDLRPLSARSVVLSLLLGAHPARLDAARLTEAAVELGVPIATARVALSRAVAGGDLLREDGAYALAPRHVARQARQDEAVADLGRPWDGTWETAVVVASGRSASERAALRTALAARRLAELREGVWMRPANLRREDDRAGADDGLEVLEARPRDPRALAARLWDLPGWAGAAEAWGERLRDAAEPGVRLAAAAGLVRHLATDPLLPAELLPSGWPGARLRRQYAGYRGEVRRMLDRAAAR
ncbi:PaaX family transcriptional regulator C-terminal domain-containing protein [Nocardioides zeae]|uniref:PaaX family transcriptional regulator C-terminal domain-containing protein n=1 Tax=Nocardioides imazamoxiresistens TaxID=3231893 RepID=A0ABU3PWW7_9ACTN|nr:PaaX family transcriptional regulator C-terminal domain-containing protein [Nocardioides zeae]MDT9593732.1 PaaX family transcriptional regulator C-terminal domain-containing protein [Nocardioides zeae]